jgi:hypothetical protein
VRKLSAVNPPSQANAEAFNRAARVCWRRCRPTRRRATAPQEDVDNSAAVIDTNCEGGLGYNQRLREKTALSGHFSSRIALRF